MTNKQNYKLTDKQFLAMLKENNGIFSRVAAAIQNKYGINYSRQAVFERSKKFAEELREIRESVMDYSEGRLMRIVIDDDSDDKLGAKIATYMLESLGKERGYGQRGNTPF